MDALRTDLRFAIRALLAKPGFAALSILTLAIGIGVNAVAFSGLNAFLFKPTRFADASTLGWIAVRSPGNPYGQTTFPDYQSLVQSSQSFEDIIAEGRMPLALHDGPNARQIWGLLVSSNYLTTLRVHAHTGRVFTSADRTATEVPAVVSYRFWMRELGGAPLAGRTLTINARSVSVIGVLPDAFQGPGGFFSPDIWIPLERIDVLGMSDRLSPQFRPWLGMVGRLAPGVTAARASAELQSLSANAARDVAQPRADRTLVFNPMIDGNPEVRSLAPMAYGAVAIVGVVLLIACFNVAGLLLARASDRQRETSVRAALGASRSRIVRQFALEGLMIAAVSGAAAIVVAGWSADLLSAFSLPAPIPQRLHIGVDRRVIGFTAVLVALAGILPTLVPALQSTRADLLRTMRLDTAAGGRRSRTRSLFIVAQITGATLFLSIAALMVQSFMTDARTGPGFEIDRLLVAELQPSNFGYDAGRTREFFENLVSRVRMLPGVEHVSVADRVPFYVGFPKVTKVSADGADCRSADCRSASVYAVGADHFRALGVRLIEGREFNAAELHSGDGAIVSETMAARLWPSGNAVGRWIREGADGRLREIVGVAATISHRTLNESPADYLYRPILPSEYEDRVTLIVRTSTPAAPFVAKVYEQVRALDPALPPGDAKTMAQRMEMPLWPARTAATFFLTCGMLALVLATVGLFGITYLAVGQRTREFGIRAALGATEFRIARLVLAEGLWLALPGVTLGIVGAALIGRVLSSALFEVHASDPLTYIASGAVQIAVALAACLVPAIRATRADPALALRAE
jgi:predicted permease